MSDPTPRPTADDELQALTDPDQVLAQHGLVAATHPTMKRDLALDLLHQEEPARPDS